MSNSYNADRLKHDLETLSEVESIGEIEVEDNIIKYISIVLKEIGKVTAQQLEVSDAAALFDFYFKGISEKPRRLFIPYPLFRTPPNSIDEMSQRIADWKKEDDWTALKLVKDKQIIGFGLLKRFWTEQVTSGIVIRGDYLKMGLGYLLQTIIIGQARLLNLKKFHVKVISDNSASVRLHEKCGFKQTGIVAWDGYEDLLTFLSENDNKKGGNEVVDRHIIEMVLELNHE